MNTFRANTTGFTLIELLVGIAILIILVGVAIVAGNSARMRAYNTQALVCGEQIRKAQTLYYSENQRFADDFAKLDKNMTKRCALVAVVEVTATANGYQYTVAHARGNAKYTIEDDRAGSQLAGGGASTVLASGGNENGVAGASDTSGGGTLIVDLPTSNPSDPFAYVTFKWAPAALAQFDSQYQTGVCAEFVTSGLPARKVPVYYGQTPAPVTFQVPKGNRSFTIWWHADTATCTNYSSVNNVMAFRITGGSTASHTTSGSNATVNVTADTTLTIDNGATQWAWRGSVVDGSGTPLTSLPSSQTQMMMTTGTNTQTALSTAPIVRTYDNSVTTVYGSGGMTGLYSLPSGGSTYIWNDPDTRPGNRNATSYYNGGQNPLWTNTIRVHSIEFGLDRKMLTLTNPGPGRVVATDLKIRTYDHNVQARILPKAGTRAMTFTNYNAGFTFAMVPTVAQASYTYGSVPGRSPSARIVGGSIILADTFYYHTGVRIQPPATINEPSGTVRWIRETAPVDITVTDERLQSADFYYRREVDPAGNGTWTEQP